MPLSVTVKTRRTRPRVTRALRTSSRTAPRSVNFTALSMRFSSAARSRTVSPTSTSGKVWATVTSVARPLVSARADSDSAKSAMKRRGRNASCCNVSAVTSALAASIISVVSEARCLALLLMPEAQRRSRSPRLELASNSPSARMPVSAVRMSCAYAASEASVPRASGAGRTRRRLRLRAGLPLDVLAFNRAMAAPRRQTHHATAGNQTKQALDRSSASEAPPCA